MPSLPAGFLTPQPLSSGLNNLRGGLTVGIVGAGQFEGVALLVGLHGGEDHTGSQQREYETPHLVSAVSAAVVLRTEAVGAAFMPGTDGSVIIVDDLSSLVVLSALNALEAGKVRASYIASFAAEVATVSETKRNKSPHAWRSYLSFDIG